MSKRKIQISIIAILLVVMFLAVLVGTFSRPAPANVRMTFSGYTLAPRPTGFKNSGVQITNASFFVSNAGPSKVRLTFLDYQFNSGDSTALIRPSGLGMLCMLEPGQSTNLVVPMIPHIHRFGRISPDYRWRVELTSRNDWLGKLEQQPKWLQNAITKIVPSSWIANLYRADIVSDWITNREPESDFLQMLNVSPFTNTNSGTP
jgi:hypothetical protein